MWIYLMFSDPEGKRQEFALYGEQMYPTTTTTLSPGPSSSPLPPHIVWLRPLLILRLAIERRTLTRVRSSFTPFGPLSDQGNVSQTRVR